MPSVQCPQPSALSSVPSVQCPQSSTLSPASRAALPPYLQGEKKTAQCPLPSALSPVPSAQCPQSSALSPVPSVQCPQSSTLSPVSRAIPPPYLQGEKKTASTGKNSKEKRAELRPEKKSKQPGSWPGAPPHLGGKKNFFKGGVGPRANQSRLLELFFQGEPLLDLPRDSIPAETDQKE